MELLDRVYEILQGRDRAIRDTLEPEINGLGKRGNVQKQLTHCRTTLQTTRRELHHARIQLKMLKQNIEENIEELETLTKLKEPFSLLFRNL